MILLLHQGAISPSTLGLQIGIGIAISLTCFGLVFHGFLKCLGKRLRLHEAEIFKKVQPALTIAVGCTLGALVSLTSVGAGAIGAILLIWLYPLRLTPDRLVATDIAHVPLAFFAGVGHFFLGDVNFLLLAWLLLVQFLPFGSCTNVNAIAAPCSSALLGTGVGDRCF